MVIFREPHGASCQNSAHLRYSANVTMEQEFCEACVDYGARMRSINTFWTLPKLLQMPTTCPMLFVLLALYNKEVYGQENYSINI
jgi:hypothetical protein